MKDFALHQVLAEIWHVVAEANRYFASQEPWTLRKTDPARMANVLDVTAEVLRRVAIFAQPVHAGKDGGAARSAGRERRRADLRQRHGRAAPFRPGRRCPRPPASSRAMSSRKDRGRQERTGACEDRLSDMLIDSHCHLDFPDFAADRAGVLARARAAGVGRMITISTRVDRYDDLPGDRRGANPTSSSRSARIRIRPTRSRKRASSSSSRSSTHPKCVGIGEAGLDYHYDRAPRDVAARVFRTHIAAARETGLPLVIHARDADEDVAAILQGRDGEGARSRPCSIASRRRGCWPRPGSRSACTSRSPAS